MARILREWIRVFLYSNRQTDSQKNSTQFTNLGKKQYYINLSVCPSKVISDGVRIASRVHVPSLDDASRSFGERNVAVIRSATKLICKGAEGGVSTRSSI